MLANRLANRMRHLAKWGRRRGISCFRLYERDIPDYPAIIDWYADADAANISADGDAVAWFFQRTKDDTPEEAATYLAHAEAEILSGLDIPAGRLHIKHRGRQRGEEGGREQYQRVGTLGHTKVVDEHGLKFEINLSDYLDVGLFLDHRPTRQAIRERCEGKRVLNLFSYTGAFSIHARAGGAASTTTIDMSKTYMDWYARNLALNGWSLNDSHRSVRADCLAWIDRATSRDEPPYDIIICDPPTFSNSKRMTADSFAIDRDLPELMHGLSQRVAPKGEIIFSTNAKRFNFTDAAIPRGFGCHEISNRSVPDDFRNKRIHRCWRLVEGWT
ncbi:MAG: class I SAM-dependent methyltransferase [Phycisphaerales bacterium]|jgi:23S rRNA (cytosine1962-C5)-methyltransferase|nr:class I SAM-dependent methyltransferase [Phycisphaerales bacterium]